MVPEEGQSWAMAEGQQTPPWKRKLMKPKAGVMVLEGGGPVCTTITACLGPCRWEGITGFPSSSLVLTRQPSFFYQVSSPARTDHRLGPNCKPSQPQRKVQTLHSSRRFSPLSTHAGWPCPQLSTPPILPHMCDTDSYPNTALLISYRSQAIAPTAHSYIHPAPGLTHLFPQDIHRHTLLSPQAPF